MVDAVDPNLSFIAFAQGEELRADQLLYFNDLYGMPLDNELTVLSACETALGQLQAGETTMSMASAFAAAGARSTVTTLWQIDDAATKDIIVDFYRGLGSGKTRATALHDAQSRQLETEYAHPYYWSGIMLYGTPDTLSLDMVNSDGYLPWWGWLIVAGLVAGLLFYVLRFLHGYKPADL
jgi:CHAT domain-containing protein